MEKTNSDSRCGIDCSKCKFREQMNCKGCIAMNGQPFWGECAVAKCNIHRELKHCGQCKDFVCDILHKFAYDEKQGDNGLRIENLKKRRAMELK